MLHFQDGIQRHLGRKRQIFYFSAGNNSQAPQPQLKLSLKPFSKGLRSLEAEPQVARRNGRNPLLIFASRKSTKTKNKSAVRRRRNIFAHKVRSWKRPSERTVFPENFARCGERFFIIFRLKPGPNTGFQKGISDSAESDSGQQCPRVRALAEQVGHSLAGKRPTGAFSGSARFEKGWRKL